MNPFYPTLKKLDIIRATHTITHTSTTHTNQMENLKSKKIFEKLKITFSVRGKVFGKVLSFPCVSWNRRLVCVRCGWLMWERKKTWNGIFFRSENSLSLLNSLNVCFLCAIVCWVTRNFQHFFQLHTHTSIIVTRRIFLQMHFAWESGVFQDFSGTRSCFQYRSTSIHHEFFPFLVSSIAFNFPQIEEFSKKKNGMRWKIMSLMREK